jgi:16S rRNA processing protein RimM
MVRESPESAVQRVCVGQFAGAHGVRGLVRIRSFTEEPMAVASYGPVEDESGAQRFEIHAKSMAKGNVVAEIDGIADREAAQRLNGMRLYVARDRLPALEEEDDFYQADLIGCAVVDLAGAPLGTVKDVHDFGAGCLLEVARPDAPALLVPFTEAVVPVVDMAQRRLTIDPPVETVATEQDDAAERPRGDAA